MFSPRKPTGFRLGVLREVNWSSLASTQLQLDDIETCVTACQTVAAAATKGTSFLAILANTIPENDHLRDLLLDAHVIERIVALLRILVTGNYQKAREAAANQLAAENTASSKQPISIRMPGRTGSGLGLITPNQRDIQQHQRLRGLMQVEPHEESLRAALTGAIAALCISPHFRACFRDQNVIELLIPVLDSPSVTVLVSVAEALAGCAIDPAMRAKIASDDGLDHIIRILPWIQDRIPPRTSSTASPRVQKKATTKKAKEEEEATAQQDSVEEGDGPDALLAVRLLMTVARCCQDIVGVNALVNNGRALHVILALMQATGYPTIQNAAAECICQASSLSDAIRKQIVTYQGIGTLVNIAAHVPLAAPAVAGALSFLSLSERSHAGFLTSDAIAVLGSLLNSESVRAKVYGTITIANVAAFDSGRAHLSQRTSIMRSLLDLALPSSPPEVHTHALIAIARLAKTDNDTASSLINKDTVSRMVRLLGSNNRQVAIAASSVIASLYYQVKEQDNETLASLLQENDAPKALIGMLSGGDAESNDADVNDGDVNDDICAALVFAAYTSYGRSQICAAGGVPILLDMVTVPNAVHALTVLCASSTAIGLVRSHGGIPIIVALLKQSCNDDTMSPMLIRRVLELVATLCRNQEAAFDITNSEAIHSIAVLAALEDGSGGSARYAMRSACLHDLSAKFWTTGQIGHESIISLAPVGKNDKGRRPFYDVGRRASFLSLETARRMPISPRHDAYFIVVDPSPTVDPQLCALITQCKQANGAVKYMADAVSTAMGGSVAYDDYAQFSYEESLYATRQELGTPVIPIGKITRGVGRHRALLFKVLCDACGVPCSLVRGEYSYRAHAWNVVHIDHEDYVVDLLHDVGGLVGVGEAYRYMRQ